MPESYDKVDIGISDISRANVILMIFLRANSSRKFWIRGSTTRDMGFNYKGSVVKIVSLIGLVKMRLNHIGVSIPLR